MTKRRKGRGSSGGRSGGSAGRSRASNATSGTSGSGRGGPGKASRDAGETTEARTAPTSSSARGTAPRRRAGSGRTGSSRPPTQASRRPPPSAPLVLQPPVLSSLARGLFAAASSPVLLVVTFLGVLVIWAIYASTGIIRVAYPGVVAQIQALAPIHSALDTNFFVAGTRVFAPVNVISLALVLLVIRTVSEAVSISLVLDRFEGGAGGWGGLRAAWGRAVGSMQQILALEALFMVLILLLPAVLGPLLGPLSLVITFIAPTYFLVYAPVVAVSERVTLRDTFRLSLRMARLRGPQHVVLVFAYVMISVVLIFSTSGGRDTPITPSVLVWVYVLFTNFVHVSVLAAVTYRWLLRRQEVLEAAEARAQSGPGPRRRLFGLR